MQNLRNTAAVPLTFFLHAVELLDFFCSGAESLEEFGVMSCRNLSFSACDCEWTIPNVSIQAAHHTEGKSLTGPEQIPNLEALCVMLAKFLQYMSCVGYSHILFSFNVAGDSFPHSSPHKSTLNFAQAFAFCSSPYTTQAKYPALHPCLS